MRKGKKSLLMLLCSVCTAVLMMLWPVKPVMKVQAAVVQRGELVQSVLLSGTVRYAQEQPCISLKNGVISDVHVSTGQTVRQGDLLFSLDTAAEEQALASLYEMKYAYLEALAGVDTPIAALTLQTELEWQQQEMQLMAGIEASQIRAVMDGVMDAVYVEEGDFVAETTLLGLTRGTGRQIAAVAYTGDIGGIYPGAAAMAKRGGKSFSVTLKRIEAAADASGFQMLYFEPLDESALSECRAGEAVQVELATQVHPVSALIPLSAIDADGKVWLIEDGKAYAYEVSLDEYSRTYASADLDWAGCTMILYPEQYNLNDGIPVRVIK